ncbi:hypothetical protein ACFOSS_05900, partial [Pseudaeromonas sharmana]
AWRLLRGVRALPCQRGGIIGISASLASKKTLILFKNSNISFIPRPATNYQQNNPQGGAFLPGPIL